MPAPVIIIVVVLLAIFAIRFLQRLSLPETLSYVDPHDPELLNAIADAQTSLPYFWDKRASALNPDDYFLKVRLEGPKDAESIWISNPSIEGDEVTGIVNQSPALLDVKEGDRVRCAVSSINDWMYTESDRIHGNFTGRVLAKPQNMNKRQYEEILKSFAPLPTAEELKDALPAPSADVEPTT